MQDPQSTGLTPRYPSEDVRSRQRKSDLERVARRAPGALLQAYKKFANDWTMNLVVVVAYNLLTSFFPLILAVITLVAWIPMTASDTSHLAAQINSILPADVRSTIHVQSLLTNVQHARGLLGVVSIAGLLWGGSNLFGAIESAFAVIFRVKTRGFLHQKAMSLVMILLFVVLLPLSFISTIFLSAATTTLGKILPISAGGPIGLLIGFAASYAALFLLFLAIYLVVPNLPVTWRHVWRGALIAALVMWIINTIFPFYTAHFVNSKQYGAAAIGSAIITITWFWFFAVALLVGAQVNALALEIGPWPYDLSRMLTQIKLPVQGGELTDMAAARDDMTSQDTQSPFGVARDVPEKLHADTGDRSGGLR